MAVFHIVYLYKLLDFIKLFILFKQGVLNTH
jgi:hypothetical protein